MRLLLAGVLLLGACATTSATKTPAGPQRINMEPIRIEVKRRGNVLETEIVDAETLFTTAGELLAAREFDAAIAHYDRVLRDFADSQFAPAALYNAGLAHEGKGDWAGAARRYQQVVDRFASSADQLDALFRLGGVYAEMRDFRASAETFGRIVLRSDLNLSDRVEALARQGLALKQLGKTDEAAKIFRNVLTEYRKNEFLERIDSPFFVAMAQYYLGEMEHERFRAAPIRLPEEQMAKDLDEKAGLLLSAHTAYIDTIKLKDPTWATAAGYQLGLLYREFYEAILNAPIPPELNAEARQIYIEQLRTHEKMRLLLEKALSVYEKTLLTAERIGVRNEWVQRAKDEIEGVRAILRGQAAGMPAGAPTAPPPSPTAPTSHDQPAPSFIL
jgi:TolA-binding protein